MVTQEQLAHAAELQAAAWTAERLARECVQELERRISHGAQIEEGPLVFDRGLQMARRRVAAEA